MKKLFLLLLCLTVFWLVGCDDTSDVPDPDTPPQTGGYQDPLHRKGTYKIEFQLFGKTVTHFYEAGEIPEPPEVAEVKDDIYLYTFDGWDRTPEAVTRNAIYVAKYDRTVFEYTATFLVAGGRQVRVKAEAGTVAEAPSVPDYLGMQFACWDVEPYEAKEDVTYTAIYTKTMTPALMKSALSYGPWSYVSHHFRDMQPVVAVHSLLREIREGNEAPLLVDRVVEHIVSYSESKGPEYDLNCLWAYGMTTALFALAKQTPVVWEKLSYSTVKRIDTLMEAFAIVESLGTSDNNNFKTGPALTFNYGKTWNPNYRLGNVTVMVFVTHYFGDGDMTLGAERVNGILKGFDATAYEAILRRFSNYGFENAFNCWSTAEAKAMLLDGVAPAGGGSGVGAHNGGRDYLYQGLSLSEGREILRNVIAYNYSGGKVQTEYWWNGERVAWILDGTTTPYLGEEGMMLEFASGSRSSTIYCDHDFVMCIFYLDIARELRLYTKENGVRTPVTDAFGNPEVLWDVTKDVELWHKVQIGNEDFLYKFIHGYMSYYIYASGPSQTPFGESNGASFGSSMMKNLWRTVFLPLGTVEPAT